MVVSTGTYCDGRTCVCVCVSCVVVENMCALDDFVSIAFILSMCSMLDVLRAVLILSSVCVFCVGCYAVCAVCVSSGVQCCVC